MTDKYAELAAKERALVEAYLIVGGSNPDMRGVRLAENTDLSCRNDNWKYEPLIRLSDYAALQAERDALMDDKARLDFMDQVAKRQGYDGFRLDYAIGDHEVLPGFLFHYRQQKENVGIRAVIDAARAAGGEE